MRIPKPKVLKRRRRCENCGELLDAIWFTATMTEEWVWTGRGYTECSAHNSLVDDPHMPVRCPNCEVESYHLPAKLKVWAKRQRDENAVATIIISGLAATYKKNIADGDWPKDLQVFCIETNDWKTLVPPLLSQLLKLSES